MLPIGATEAISLPARDWVAIIDDDASVRLSLSRLLKANGIFTETFSSAEAYLQRSVPGYPQCIVLDVLLIGGLNGTDLHERLAFERVTPPVIFMTGQDELKPALLARFPDLSCCLRKPFDMGALMARIQPHLLPVAAVQSA